MKLFSTLLFAAITLPSALTAQELTLDFAEGHILRIGGGEPDSVCLLAIGFEQQKLALPGGAILRLKPAMLLPLARLDAKGEFSMWVPSASDEHGAGEFLIQAFSYLEGSIDAVRASALNRVAYDAAQGYSMTELVSDEDGVNRGDKRIRRLSDTDDGSIRQSDGDDSTLPIYDDEDGSVRQADDTDDGSVRQADDNAVLPVYS